MSLRPDTSDDGPDPADEPRQSLEQLRGAFREAERRFQSLFDHVPVGLYRTTLDGRIVDANPALLQMLGYPDRTSLEATATELYVDPDERCRSSEALRRDGEIRDFEVRLRRRDGTVIEVRDNARYVHDERGEFFEGSLEDITRRKRADEELEASVGRLRGVMVGTIEAMALISEMRDPHTAGHQRRVSLLACAIATELGLPDDRVEGIRLAALIHDIGKIYVPAEILSKPGRLSHIERALIRLHPEVGFEVLKTIQFPWPIATVVVQHHELLNGEGYPARLSGDQILMESRIVGVADVVEAMASHRPYRPALGIKPALAQVDSERVTHYDPVVVDACLRLFAEGRFLLE